jgi:hypothetical protein
MRTITIIIIIVATTIVFLTETNMKLINYGVYISITATGQLDVCQVCVCRFCERSMGVSAGVSPVVSLVGFSSRTFLSFVSFSLLSQ